MSGAIAGDSAGKYLASLGYVSLELSYVLVIDLAFLTTENANFFSTTDAALTSHGCISFVGLIVSHYKPPI